MLFNALQLGVHVEFDDLAFHTFMDLCNFASKALGGKDEVKPMNMGELRAMGKTRW